MTENLRDVMSAYVKLEASTQKVINFGWPEADGLHAAIQANLRYLATGHNRGDDFTTARIEAHRQCLACLEAYNEAIDAPGRHEPQYAFVEQARLLSARLFELRQHIKVVYR